MAAMLNTQGKAVNHNDTTNTAKEKGFASFYKLPADEGLSFEAMTLRRVVVVRVFFDLLRTKALS